MAGSLRPAASRSLDSKLQKSRRLPPLRHYAATVLPPRRNGGVKAEQELLSLARLCGFLLGINSGLVKNTTDFFLEVEELTAEERSGGCFDGRRGGRPRGGGTAGTTGQSEITGLSRSTETASTLEPI